MSLNCFNAGEILSSSSSSKATSRSAPPVSLRAATCSCNANLHCTSNICENRCNSQKIAGGRGKKGGADGEDGDIEEALDELEEEENFAPTFEAIQEPYYVYLNNVSQLTIVFIT
ncbi:hypothetical protein CEXT_744391 [Caerostris extrusa]|uniref:Uncharacterized protein n=1 Tax=Caerostris extrusa TaxID=172846 RepID=A0AAV4PFJ7_CAEEX|nr:hypothetical protein CEXT_744391 [Caerostris extrusa]